MEQANDLYKLKYCSNASLTLFISISTLVHSKLRYNCMDYETPLEVAYDLLNLNNAEVIAGVATCKQINGTLMHTL